MVRNGLNSQWSSVDLQRMRYFYKVSVLPPADGGQNTNRGRQEDEHGAQESTAVDGGSN